MTLVTFSYNIITACLESMYCPSSTHVRRGAVTLVRLRYRTGTGYWYCTSPSSSIPGSSSTTRQFGHRHLQYAAIILLVFDVVVLTDDEAPRNQLSRLLRPRRSLETFAFVRARHHTSPVDASTTPYSLCGACRQRTSTMRAASLARKVISVVFDRRSRCSDGRTR